MELKETQVTGSGTEAEAPEAQTEQQPNTNAAAPAVEEKRPGSVEFEHIVFVLLDTSRADFTGLKSQLSAISTNVGGAEVVMNGYSPFSSGKSSTGEGPAGFLRTILGGIFATAGKVVERNVVFVGKDRDIQARINFMAGNVAAAISRCGPFRADDVLIDGQTAVAVEGAENEGETIQLPPIKFGDLFAINSWSNVSQDAQGLVDTVTVNTCLRVNAGAFYDTKDPVKYVQRALNVVRATVERIDENFVGNVFFGILYDSVGLLTDPRLADLSAELIDNGSFDGFATVRSVLAGELDWLNEKNMMKFFSPTSDVCTFRPLIVEEPDGDSGEAAE